MSDDKVKILIKKGGWARIMFPKIEIELPDGTIIEKTDRVSLCRCSKTSSPPFCDSTHKTCDFEKDLPPSDENVT